MINANINALHAQHRYIDSVAPLLSTIEVGAVADNKIVQTYNEALDTGSVPATTDFTLVGSGLATISSVAVAGSAVTLTLSGDIYDFEVITLSYTAGANPIRDVAENNAANLTNQSVTNNSSTSAPSIISDGNTVAWFDAAVNITKDVSNFVSVWGDKSGLNHHLLQASGTNQPLWSADGVLFDGVDNFMQTATFPLEQPEMIYIVFKQITWTDSERITDGFNNYSGNLYQYVSTPGLSLRCGAAVASANNNLTLNTFGIARVLFSGAGSKITINDTAPLVMNPGFLDMDGLTLGSRALGDTFFAHCEIKEVILRKIADTAPSEAEIYAYLASKYSIS